MPMNPRLLVPRAAGSFDPRKISGLEVWLDAADTSTITLNSGNVSQWNDKSGKGRNFTQGTAIKQPAYSTTYFAKGAVHFDGSDDVMSNQTASNWVWSHREATWVVAYRFNDTVDDKLGFVPVIMGTVEQYNNAGPVGFTWWLEDRSSNTSRLQMMIHNGAADNVFTALFGPNSMPEIANTVIGLRYSATGTKAASATLNGTAQASPATTGTAAAATGNPTFGLSIGANSHSAYAGFRFGKYRIAEVMGWSRSLSDSELSSAARYLGRKWGITVA